MNIAILGNGEWATALASVFAYNDHKVTLIGRDEKAFDYEKNINIRYFPDIVLSKNISYSTSLSDSIKNCEAILFCVPSHAYRNKAKEVTSLLDHEVIVLSAAKGFDPLTFDPLMDVLREEIPSKYLKGVVSLVGPSFAREVIHNKITTISAVSKDNEISKYIQKELSTPYFRIYTNEDEIGCQVASALKNVIAIAGGAIYGLGEGENAKAGLVTRGLQEGIRLGICLGGKAETFFGLTGIGDLLLTCSSMQSRNYSLGYEIGKCDNAKVVLERNNKTVEGVLTCKLVHSLALQHNIDMPIVTAVYRVLYDNIAPSVCIKETMSRSLKSEH